jgi:hypothetical protein
VIQWHGWPSNAVAGWHDKRATVCGDWAGETVRPSVGAIARCIGTLVSVDAMALEAFVPGTGGHRHNGHWQGGTAVRWHGGAVHGLGGAATRWDAVVRYAVAVARQCNGSTTRWCTGALV